MRRKVTPMLVGLVVAGCSGSGTKTDNPNIGLAPYEAEFVKLFDDSIHPAAFGVSLEAIAPEADPLLRSRATEADTASRLRVQTVTFDSVGAKANYTITVQVGRPTLMPQKVEAFSYDLFVQRKTSAFGLVQAQEKALRENKTFIGFVRRFATEDGPQIHWHLTADTPAVAAVVEEIAVLEEVAGEQLQ